MKKSVTFFLLTICALIYAAPTENPQEKIILKEYFPTSFHKLYIQPAIPQDYSVYRMTGSGIYNNIVFWVPSECEGKHNTSEYRAFLGAPGIRANAFSKLRQQELNPGLMKKTVEHELQGVKNLKVTEFQWGKYPGIEISCVHEGEYIYHAYVGMNAPEDKVMHFALNGYPPKKKPSKKFISFWNHFIQNTKELPQSLQTPNRSLMVNKNRVFANISGHQIEMTLECRKSDKKIDDHLVKIPYDTGFSIGHHDIQENASSKPGDKIQGTLWCDWYFETDEYAVNWEFPVFVNMDLVDEFSPNDNHLSSNAAFKLETDPLKIYKLNVDLGIPEDYIATINPEDPFYIFWTPSECYDPVKKILRESKKPTLAMIEHPDFTQIILNKKTLEEFYQEDANVVKAEISEFNWGKYTGFKIAIHNNKGEVIRNCLINSNSDDGKVLGFMHLPSNFPETTENDLIFWENFINNTKEKEIERD